MTHDWSALASQVQHACRHFNGLLMGQCQAGVVYNTIVDQAADGLARWPCFPAGAALPCPLRAMPPQEGGTDGP